MEKVKIFIDGLEKEVNAIFYLYNSKYYFIYTEIEIDENGYVVLHVVKVAKEIKATPDGPLDTGYMVGVEISDDIEWKEVQISISEIVEDKKNNTVNPKIQYLPMSMLTTLKIMSKKTFRLMKDIIKNNFGLELDLPPVINTTVTPVSPILAEEAINPIPIVSEESTVSEIKTDVPVSVSVPLSSINSQPITVEESTIPSVVLSQNDIQSSPVQGDVIIDYRTKFFEEQETNKQLQAQIDELTKKINNVKEIIG